MKRLFCILASTLALAAGFAQTGNAQTENAQAGSAQTAADDWFWGKPIASIEWNGVLHADRKELDATVRPFVGKAFTEELWGELQAQVYALDWFDTIDPAAYPADVERTKVLVKFVVKEKPSVSAIRVAGNSGLRSTEILDSVQEKVGDIFSASKAKLDELAVKKLYLDKGYPNAEVSSSTNQDEGGVSVTFLVNEGSLVAIKEIHFEGNQVFDAKQLQAQMELKAQGFLQPGVFQEAKLEGDKQKLVDFYRARGYADARVVDVVRGLKKDEKSSKLFLVLTFVLDEGRLWYYGGVSFEGNQVFSTEKLASFFTQKKGGLLNSTKLAQEKQAMDDLYYENGYIFNRIDLEQTRDAATSTVYSTVKISEHDRAHIESITFKGNLRTKDEVLARELPLEVGDIFSKAKIIEGMRNLYGLQYFSSIEPQLLPGSDENLMNLQIAVEEQSTADIQFGVTLSGIGNNTDAFPLSGLIKWNEKNFLGKGQGVGVELNASPTDQTMTLSFSDNWLFGKRISGGLSLSLEHKHLSATQDITAPLFDNGVPDPYSSYEEYLASTVTIADAYRMPYEYWAASLGASSGYSRHTALGDLGFSYGFSSGISDTVYDTTKYRPSSKDMREIANTIQWTNKIPLRAYLNNLDLWYNPSSGYYASERFTIAGLTNLESQHYLRSDTRLEGYATLFNIPVFEGWNLKWVVGGHSALTSLLPQKVGGLAQVSPSDDLHVDGTFVGRGWSSLYSVEDGRTLWDNSIELRMPVLDQYFWLDGFVDVEAFQTAGGLLRITDTSYSIDQGSKLATGLGWSNLIMSAGFGVRFTIPQFPFRFYFAKRFSFDGTSINWKPSGSSGALDFVISISQSLN
jgi:outer membrane protein insertion porin family